MHDVGSFFDHMSSSHTEKQRESSIPRLNSLLLEKSKDFMHRFLALLGMLPHLLDVLVFSCSKSQHETLLATTHPTRLTRTLQKAVLLSTGMSK